jgi:hypothetical protein
MQDGPTISNLPEGHNLTTSTVVINSPAATVTPGSPLVKVLIKYPSDWKKDKFFKDGDIKEVSPETAATFVEIGIATMVDQANEAPAADVSDNGEQDNEDESEDNAAAQEEHPATEVKKGKKGK